ncbi:hypothetical protein Tsubulata_022294 [Turnera subulata]|uniref:DUF4283 domain-containing protein n=1 Tax=Turnera subulata TaxID=218843 RepID=A0A9Q0JEM9_9ROSI|nr:hypothetical protein Tsubulata_022294 [Turnera subulata]
MLKMRFGFVRYRGIRDLQRLLADVNRVETGEGTLRTNKARERAVNRSITKAYSGITPGRGQRVEQGHRYIDTVKNATTEGGIQGPTKSDPGVMFIPTTDNIQWLARSAMGVLRNPASMASVHLLWVLHGVREVEVSDMGGDRVLVSFPTSESMQLFLQQNHDWIRLWFASFSPWQEGDRAVNRRCWIQVRGLPLHVWCREFFEFLGSLFGKLVSVHPLTEQRKSLGAARLEIITE